MGKILNILSERANANQIAEMRPYAIYHNMLYYIVRTKHGSKPFIDDSNFSKKLLEQIWVEKALFCGNDYTEYSPKNQVLLHGIMYNSLYNTYASFLKSSRRPDKNNQTIIDATEYNKIPKRYRSIFVKFDDNHYILNTANTTITVAYNKVEQLLNRAKALIPVIYKESAQPDENIGGILEIYYSPAFVKDSFSANFVTDKEIDAIRKLHDIFVEISKITLPAIDIKQNEHSVALDLYQEYKNPRQKMPIDYLLEKHTTNEEIQLEQERKKYEEKVQYIKQGYKDLRSETIGFFINKVRTKTK